MSGDTDVVVLVPAHDEEGTVAHCVQAFENQTYPRDRYRVVVVADNCTDDTAGVASRAGAEVLVRNEPDARGKGRALRWAMDELLARDEPPDAVVVVDADSTPDPDLLTGLVAHFEEGAQAVQGESLIVGDGSPEQELRAAAFLLVNRARPTGRAMLGLAPDLAGNGMLFGRRLLAEHPWSAFSSTEDLEYGLELRAAGIEPVFARGAIVRSPAAPHGRAAEAQQLRWEGGKLHLARTHVPKLLAKGRVDAAVELAIPPLGYLTAAAGALTAVAVALRLAGRARRVGGGACGCRARGDPGLRRRRPRRREGAALRLCGAGPRAQVRRAQGAQGASPPALPPGQLGADRAPVGGYGAGNVAT